MTVFVITRCGWVGAGATVRLENQLLDLPAGAGGGAFAAVEYPEVELFEAKVEPDDELYPLDERDDEKEEDLEEDE